MSNYLPFLEQEQLWIYNKQEKLSIAEALGFRIYELEKRIFITRNEVEEINTLTKVLNRLGYDVHEKNIGEWTRTEGKPEFFYRKKEEQDEKATQET
jgi:hypothetical protein